MVEENPSSQKHASDNNSQCNSTKPEIPVAIKEKWQRMVNIMSNLLRVPTGFIMKVNGPHIQIFTSNEADTNPYHAGQDFELSGLYCEEVMKSDKLLLVPDALKDPEWDDNPEIPAGFIYYLGYPIHWPSGKMFGTICVQDYENNLHATDNKDLLEEFRSVCELDLLMIQQQLNLESIVAQRTAELTTANKSLRVEVGEHKRAREELVKSEAKYRDLVDQSIVGVFTTTRDGRFVLANIALARMYDFEDVEHMLAEGSLSRWKNPKQREQFLALLQEHGSVTNFETETVTHNGRIIHVLFSAKLHDDRIFGMVMDITDRKQKEKKLKKHGEFQKLVSRISTKFIGLSGVEFEQAIHDALAEIGRYFNSDTVRLYRLSLQGDVVKIRNQWRDEHIAPPKEMAEIHKMKYPNLAAHYSKGEATVFSKFDDSPQWPEMRKILKIFGTKAGVGVPLEIDSLGVDIFAMDKVLSDHIWPKDIVKQSRAIGKVILSAMRRREAEVELQDSYDEIKRLKDRLEQENVYLQQEVKLEHQHGEIIGSSTAIGKVLNKAEQVAKTDSTVLILGETGTGKELLARAIHDMSDRKARPMVKVNCAALPSTLIESELFGREKGAYTGAMTKQMGRFEVADGSTIFLDEISELSLDLQAKLLRVLQEGQFERLGNPKTIEVDIRVIAATNRNLAEAVQKGTFRDDLYYRLNVFPISIPPLRERREDIPTLVWHFVPELSERMGKRIESVPKKTMEALQSYPWPGNVRELRNVIENAMIVTTGSVLQVEIPKVAGSLNADNASLQEVERNHILAVLDMTGWRIRGKNGAAEILGLKPTTLESRMNKLDIQRK